MLRASIAGGRQGPRATAGRFYVHRTRPDDPHGGGDTNASMLGQMPWTRGVPTGPAGYQQAATRVRLSGGGGVQVSAFQCAHRSARQSIRRRPSSTSRAPATQFEVRHPVTAFRRLVVLGRCRRRHASGALVAQASPTALCSSCSDYSLTAVCVTVARRAVGGSRATSPTVEVN